MGSLGDSIVREIPRSYPNGVITVKYNLPQWPTPIKIRAKPDGSTHLHMNSEAGSLAYLGYNSEGKLSRVILERDTAESVDLDEEIESQQELEEYLIQSLLQRNPQASTDEIENTKRLALDALDSTDVGKDKIILLQGGRVVFYENDAAFRAGEVGATSELELGKNYDFQGDMFKLTANSVKRTLTIDTLREDGRHREVVVPMNIGKSWNLIRDLDSYYWAQIPWLNDFKFQTKG